MSQHTLWPTDWPFTTLSVGRSSCTILHYGAHIVSCKLAGSQEIFWLSPQSDYTVPVRGGNPLCWPNFGVNENFADLPKHGIARLLIWEKIDETVSKTVSSVVFFLGNEKLQSYGIPSGISLKFTVILEDGHLQTLNDSKEPFTFTECQHAYFAISDINKIFLQGLNGYQYTDRLSNSEVIHQGAEFRISKPTDIIVKNADAEVTIVDPVLHRKIMVNKTSAKITVIWNPYQEMPAEVKDISPDAFHQFICVEPTNVQDYATKVLPKSGSLLGMNITIAENEN